jgi:tripartite ATP-independent transporter DctM subunit
MGRVKGGLGVVMVVACGLFGSISGSGAATLTCIGSVMLPRMYEAGYPKGHSAALISNACVLGLLIPPSVNMILYAWVGSQSVLASFLSTVIPGIILITLLSIVNLVLLRNNKDIVVTENYSPGTTVRLLGKRAVSAIPALMIPVIILGGIYGGVMTPTEAAAVSVLYALPVGFFIYRGLSVQRVYATLKNSVTVSGVIMIMLFSVMILSRLYIMEDVPQKILNLLSAISDNPLVVLMMVNVIMIIFGMIMDDTSAILLATPLLLPVVNAMGMDGIQFAAVMGVNLGMGLVTPPCAPFLYLGARVAKAPVNEMLKPTMCFLAFAWLPTLLLTTYMPGLSKFLPRVLLGMS